MKITIKVEGPEKEEEMVFTDESLDNPNFVEVIVGGKEYTASVYDLYDAVRVFDDRRDDELD